MPANNMILMFARSDRFGDGFTSRMSTVAGRNACRIPVDRCSASLHSAAKSTMRDDARAEMPMIDVTASNEVTNDARVRGNVLRLAAAQALTGANGAVIFATGSIIGATLAPDISLATVPLSMYVLGMAAGTLPTGAISRAYGRRVAFMIGSAFGALTGALGALPFWTGRSGCSAARPSSAGSMARWRNPIASRPPTAPAPRSGRRRYPG